MTKVKATTVEQGEDLDILAALDARMKRIAAETFRALSASSDLGAVKVKTAARMLDMTEGRVRSLIKEGRLRAINPTPNTVRIPVSEIRRFQEGQQ